MSSAVTNDGKVVFLLCAPYCSWQAGKARAAMKAEEGDLSPRAHTRQKPAIWQLQLCQNKFYLVQFVLQYIYAAGTDWIFGIWFSTYLLTKP